jgi:hypothetical protein
MEINWTLVVIFLSIGIIAYLIGRLHAKPKQSDIPQDFIDLYKQVNNLPARVLSTIQGSINPQKGKVAELLTYAELRYDYDRIIPLGMPVDFIGIKNNQQIDFVEVKSKEAWDDLVDEVIEDHVDLGQMDPDQDTENWKEVLKHRWQEYRVENADRMEEAQG